MVYKQFALVRWQLPVKTIEDFVKSPSTALHCIFTHCLAELGQASVPESTTHSFIFVRFSVHLNLFAGRCRERPAMPAPLNTKYI
jgi:hypothetical protein